MDRSDLTYLARLLDLLTEAKVAKYSDGALVIEFAPDLTALAPIMRERTEDVAFDGGAPGKKPQFAPGSAYAELARQDPSMVPAWPGTAHEAPKARATVPAPSSTDPVALADRIAEKAMAAFESAESAESAESGE